MQVSSPDSGVDTYFTNSDGGHTPESEYDYCNIISQQDLDKLGAVAEPDQVVLTDEFTRVSNGKLIM